MNVKMVWNERGLGDGRASGHLDVIVDTLGREKGLEFVSALLENRSPPNVELKDFSTVNCFTRLAREELDKLPGKTRNTFKKLYLDMYKPKPEPSEKEKKIKEMNRLGKLILDNVGTDGARVLRELMLKEKEEGYAKEDVVEEYKKTIHYQFSESKDAVVNTMHEFINLWIDLKKARA